MSISTSCPTCGNSLKAPSRLAGQRIKCLRCNKLFTLSAAEPADGATTKPSSVRPEPNASSAGEPGPKGAVRLAFWLGLMSLVLGLAGGLCSFFRAATDYTHAMAWLGILLGGGAIVLAIVHEECGFRFPFAGSVASLLSLAVVTLWLGAGTPGEDMGGRPPGPAGKMDKGPPTDGKGGAPRERGKGGPWPPGPPK
jgi:hypothetical protein